MTTKRISPAVLHSLKEALIYAYWFKKDLRAFLNSCLNDRAFVAQFDWEGQYKRAIVAQLVDTLAADQHRYFDELLNLILATSDIPDPVHLKRLDDGESKYANAIAALKVLSESVGPYRLLRSEYEEAARRREADRVRAESFQAMNAKLEELKRKFHEIHTLAPQPRGYALEAFLNQLFALFDIDAKAPFSLRGEQIDGAFTFEGEYILEAKWHQGKTPHGDLEIFYGKIARRLDNTLGLFISMNGFQDTVFEMARQRRPNVILMDGGDLNAVIDGRLELPDLLRRKRQHAARTGEVFVSAYQLLA